MPLIPPNPLREKLCVFGPAKVGKTTTWLSIAKAAQDTGDERRFFCLDTDDALPVIMYDPQYEKLSNVEVTEAFEWADYRKFTRRVVKEAGPDDFVIIDMVDKAWSTAQDYGREKQTGKTREQSMMEGVKGGESGWELAGRDLDWQFVNATYNAFLGPLLGTQRSEDQLRLKGHIILISEEKEIAEAPKQAGKKDMGKQDRVALGKYKPAGQKSLAYQVRDLLRVERKNVGRTITTIGVRARPELDNEVYENFFTTYMRGPAGWTIS